MNGKALAMPVNTGFKKEEEKTSNMMEVSHISHISQISNPTKLSQIYNEDTAGLQQELQQEAFFGLASQRRKKLEQKEQAAFSGQSGTSTVSLAQKAMGSF